MQLVKPKSQETKQTKQKSSKADASNSRAVIAPPTGRQAMRKGKQNKNEAKQNSSDEASSHAATELRRKQHRQEQ